VAYRSQGNRHKVRVTDPALADQLMARGGLVLAQYEHAQLLSVDAATLEALSTGLNQAAIEARDEENLILLNATVLDTTKPELQQARALYHNAAGSEKALHLVQFVGPVKPEWYAALAETGAEIVAYIPNNAYLVYGDSADLQRVQELAERRAFMQWDGAYQDQFKLDPSVAALRENQASFTDLRCGKIQLTKIERLQP
jgi:hypothetical protein